MEFRILGPLELSDGPAVTIPAGKPRALLLALLLRANEVVPTDQLIDDLWGDSPPTTATKMIQNYVSQLRKGALADRIVTRPPGYLLRIQPGELDVDRARRLWEQARTSTARRAAESSREALALWRGRPLIDVAYENFAQVEVERLEELRLSLLESRIDADLELGRHRELVGELETLVAENPVRERFREQLMLALYRSGRQAEALDVYRRAHRAFVDELGIEPGPSLQQLHLRILEQDPKLALSREPHSQPRVVLPRRFVLAILVAAVAAFAAIAVAFVTWGGSAQPKLAANSVVRFDASGRRTAAVAVGATPRAVAAGNGGVWVANYDDRTVTRIDRHLRAGQPVGTGDAATAIAVGEGAVWIVSPFDGRLSRLDPATGRVTSVIPVGDVTGIAAGAGSVWLTNQSEGKLTRVDPHTLRTSVIRRHLAGPAGVAVSAGSVWVAESFGRDLLRINARTGKASMPIHLKLAPDDLAIGHGAAWLTNPGDNEVTRVDLQTGQARLIAVGSNPIRVAAARSHVWVVNDLDHSLSELDPLTGNVQRTISFTGGKNFPPRVRLTPGGVATDGDSVWVTVQRF